MMDLVLEGTIYLFLGIFSGLMAGVLGVGGGIIVVPGLIFLFRLHHIIPESAVMHVAAGTSLAVMIFTAIASLNAHYKLGEILWSVYKKLWSGIVVGTIIGAVTANLMPTDWLEIIFALFIFCVAFKMLADMHVTHAQSWPRPWVNRLISTLIGFNAGLLGVGGGLMIIPYLTYCGLAMQKISALSNLCTLTIAIVGTAIFIFTGWQDMHNIPYSFGYVYLPAALSIAIPSSVIAPFGTKLNYLLPVKQLKYGFIVLLFITAITLFF